MWQAVFSYDFAQDYHMCIPDTMKSSSLVVFLGIIYYNFNNVSFLSGIGGKKGGGVHVHDIF